MKKTLHLRLPALLLIILPALALTSCVEYDGPQTYIDGRLCGAWKLVAANGTPVYGYASNYFEFFRNGSGYYYEFENGELYPESINFWCEDAYSSGPSSQMLCVQYQTGSDLSTAYWFDAGGNLLMRWVTSSGPVTYTYAPVVSIP